MTPELFITRHNHLIDPFVHVWSWQIPVYLFLGGWVAGNMILTGYFMLGGRHTRRSPLLSALPGLSLVLLSLGMLALFLDLEHKAYVWRLYTTFQWTSPMSWGSWILLLVYPALVVTWLVRPPVILEDLSQTVERITTTLQGRRDIVRTIGITSMVLGVALGVYTGVLLSSLVARPLWNSGILGVLFLASGVSAAAAFGAPRDAQPRRAGADRPHRQRRARLGARHPRAVPGRRCSTEARSRWTPRAWCSAGRSPRRSGSSWSASASSFR